MELTKVIDKELVEQGDEFIKTNLFRPLVEDARSTLRRLMLNTDNDKLAFSVAESIMDRAGETKKNSAPTGSQVVITDSQVQLLLQVQKEVLDG